MAEAREVLVRNGWANAFAAVCLSAFALVLLSGATVGSNPLVGRVLLGLATASAIALIVRAARAGLLVSPECLLVRGFLVSRKITWEQVRRIAVADSGNITGTGRCIGVECLDGRILRVRGAASYSERKIQRLCNDALAFAPTTNT